MSQHPLNLGLRFLLELSALAALGYWGWTVASGFARLPLSFGLPLVAAGFWGVFRTPGDDAHGRAPPVAVPGILRLGLELLFFAVAVWGLWLAGAPRTALVFGGLVILHYASSYDRLRWLLRQG